MQQEVGLGASNGRALVYKAGAGPQLGQSLGLADYTEMQPCA